MIKSSFQFSVAILSIVLVITPIVFLGLNYLLIHSLSDRLSKLTTVLTYENFFGIFVMATTCTLMESSFKMSLQQNITKRQRNLNFSNYYTKLTTFFIGKDIMNDDSYDENEIQTLLALSIVQTVTYTTLFGFTIFVIFAADYKTATDVILNIIFCIAHIFIAYFADKVVGGYAATVIKSYLFDNKKESKIIALSGETYVLDIKLMDRAYTNLIKGMPVASSTDTLKHFLTTTLKMDNTDLTNFAKILGVNNTSLSNTFKKELYNLTPTDIVSITESFNREKYFTGTTDVNVSDIIQIFLNAKKS